MFAKNHHLHWTVGRVNIMSKYIIYLFLNFERDFSGSFPMLLRKAPATCCKKKKMELIFAALYFYIYELKKCFSDF